MNNRHIQWFGFGVSIAIVLLVLLLGAPGSAGAQPYNNSSYYEDNSSAVPNQSWLDNRSDATAENSTHMLTRIGGFIVGGGDEGGAVGALITSLLMGAIAVGFIGISRIGAVAGGTVGIVTLGGMASAGWAPSWLFALVVFGCGLVLTTVVIRSMR